MRLFDNTAYIMVTSHHHGYVTSPRLRHHGRLDGKQNGCNSTCDLLGTSSLFPTRGLGSELNNDLEPNVTYSSSILLCSLSLSLSLSLFSMSLLCCQPLNQIQYTGQSHSPLLRSITNLLSHESLRLRPPLFPQVDRGFLKEKVTGLLKRQCDWLL